MGPIGKPVDESEGERLGVGSMRLLVHLGTELGPLNPEKPPKSLQNFPVLDGTRWSRPGSGFLQHVRRILAGRGIANAGVDFFDGLVYEVVRNHSLVTLGPHILKVAMNLLP